MPDLIPSRGAIAESLLLEVRRPLEPEDFTRLGEAPKVNVPVLQKLRAVHHRQAQLLAQGKTLREVAVIVGCTPQRLTQLLRDPTFTELVSFYSDSVMVAAIEDGARMRDKLVDVGEMAVDELRQRLEDDTARSAMPTSELRQVAQFAMDRTVAPPKVAAGQTNAPTAVTISFGTAVRDDTKIVIEGEAGRPAPSGDDEA